MDDLKDKTLEELQVIAFSDVTNFASFGPSGVRLKPVTEVDPVELAAIREITISKGVVSIKLHDKVRALERLGEYLGLFSELNSAIACLRKYGIHLVCDGARWFVEEEETANPDQSDSV